MPKFRIFALTAIAAASMASTGFARDAGERGAASGVSPTATVTMASAGRNAAARSGVAASDDSGAFLVAQASATGRNDCARMHCAAAE